MAPRGSGGSSLYTSLASLCLSSRLFSRRIRSMALWLAVVVSQAPGLGGTPSAGHRSTAVANASAAASSAMSKSPKRLVRAATTRAHSSWWARVTTSRTSTLFTRTAAPQPSGCTASTPRWRGRTGRGSRKPGTASEDRLLWCRDSLVDRSGTSSRCVLRAPGRPEDLDRHALRVDARLDQVERKIRAGVREEPRALAENHGNDNQSDLVDQIVLQQPPGQGATAMHLQLTPPAWPSGPRWRSQGRRTGRWCPTTPDRRGWSMPRTWAACSTPARRAPSQGHPG